MKIPFLVYFTLLSLFSSFEVQSKAEAIKLKSNTNLFDVGLARIDEDKNYDIYTINQEYAESILLAKNGKFFESGLSLGLKQTIDQPDYEPTGRSPKIQKGLNIYTTTNRQLVIFCNECEKEVKGTLNYPTPINEKNSLSVVHKERATSEQKYKSVTGKPTIVLNFELEKTGLIVLDVTYLDLNAEFETDYPISKIFLGENSISPKNRKFSLSARNNHSFAWAKLNEDNLSDVFISSGGLRARIKQFHPRAVIQGLLYIKDIETKNFVDKYKKSKIFKENCITYRSQWVDLENDGDLDLFLGCRNGINQMYRQYGIGKGVYENIAVDYNFAFYHGEEFKWIDIDGNNSSDLIIIQNNNLYIYQNTISNQFRPIIKKYQIFHDLGNKLNSVNSSIKTFDVNNNGLPEILFSTKDTIHYFAQDENKKYEKKDLSSLNLPKDLSGKINLVDVNLDGYVDLCVFNRGIFLQTKDNKFKESKLYSELFVKRNNRYKNLIWFDTDTNGQWDVLNAESYKPENSNGKKVKLLSYEYNDYPKWDHLNIHKNISKANHNNWLQIDLEGTKYNRDAIGAKITVTTQDGVKQTRFNYGTNDSMHSQGHYRQYFGLDKNTKADVTVEWSNGESTTITGVKANQLITIIHGVIVK